MPSSTEVLKEAFKRGRLRPLNDYSKESIKQYVNPTREKFRELKEKCDVLVGKYHKWVRLYILTPGGEIVQILPYLFVGGASRVANLAAKEVKQELNINNKARVACYDYFKRFSDGASLEHLLSDILEESRTSRRKLIQATKTVAQFKNSPDNNKIDYLNFIPEFSTSLDLTPMKDPPITPKPTENESVNTKTPQPKNVQVQNPIQFTRPVQRPKIIPPPQFAETPRPVQRSEIVIKKPSKPKQVPPGIISVPVYPNAPYKPGKSCKFQGPYIIVPNRREVHPITITLPERESKRKAIEYFTSPHSKRRKRI